MTTNFDATRAVQWMRRLRDVMIIALLLLLLPLPAMPALAAGPIVVGDGTPASCTLDALNQAIADVPAGGTITFNCGPDPVTIQIGAEIYKDLTIDGGGLITFSGYSQFYVGSGTVEFMNFTIANAAGDTSGGIENRGTLTLDHVTVANGHTLHGTGGGGILNSGILTIEDSTLVSNYPACNETGCGFGGAIFNFGDLHIVNSLLSGNVSGDLGGGIYNQGTATIENSTLTGNVSFCGPSGYSEFCSSGGGIFNAGTMSLINSTVSGNSAGMTAGGSGGGIYNTGTLFLQNTTIADNTAESGAGLTNTGAVTLQNSLLAGNTGANQEPSDCSGTLTSKGYNLIGSTTGCIIDGATTGNLLNVDPVLGPLQDNGGPTFTQTLLPGSPAIDAGNPAGPGSGGTACEAADQRGVARPQDGDSDGLARCDIGAVEVQPSALTVKIDIKPGDDTNPINLKSNGVIPVAILSTSTFDATSVVPVSVQFGRGKANSVSSSLADVNGDGRLDLLLHFRTQQTGLQRGDTQACLTGQTRSGRPIHGCDDIHIVP